VAGECLSNSFEYSMLTGQIKQKIIIDDGFTDCSVFKRLLMRCEQMTLALSAFLRGLLRHLT